MINFTSELKYIYANDNYFYLRNSYFHEVYAINENHLIIDEYKKNALIIVSNTPP